VQFSTVYTSTYFIALGQVKEQTTKIRQQQKPSVYNPYGILHNALTMCKVFILLKTNSGTSWSPPHNRKHTTHLHTQAHAQKNIHTCTRAHTSTHRGTYTNTYVHAHRHRCIYTYTHVHTRAFTHTHTHTHTHTLQTHMRTGTDTQSHAYPM